MRRPGRSLIRGLVASAVAWTASVAPGAAQDRNIDGGTFEHFVGESFAGTETFAVRLRGEDVVAVGRITREGGGDPLRALEVGIRLDALGRLIRYELHTREGPAFHVVVNRTGSRLRVTTASPEGERVSELQTTDRLLVLEREIAHLYYGLAALLRDTAEPRGLRLEALIPSEGRKLPLRVVTMTRDTVAVGGAPVASTRFELQLGEETTVLWVAIGDGRITRVASPTRRWTAIRTSLD